MTALVSVRDVRAAQRRQRDKHDDSYDDDSYDGRDDRRMPPTPRGRRHDAR